VGKRTVDPGMSSAVWHKCTKLPARALNSRVQTAPLNWRQCTLPTASGRERERRREAVGGGGWRGGFCISASLQTASHELHALLWHLEGLRRGEEENSDRVKGKRDVSFPLAVPIGGKMRDAVNLQLGEPSLCGTLSWLNARCRHACLCTSYGIQVLKG
jgi:hypothetical protein